MGLGGGATNFEQQRVLLHTASRFKAATAGDSLRQPWSGAWGLGEQVGPVAGDADMDEGGLPHAANAGGAPYVTNPAEPNFAHMFDDSSWKMPEGVFTPLAERGGSLADHAMPLADRSSSQDERILCMAKAGGGGGGTDRGLLSGEYGASGGQQAGGGEWLAAIHASVV